VLAVDALDLDVRRGEIYGFLGRNGAGKTTTIRMLLGLIRPTGGQVEVLGRRVQPGTTISFARVGYLVETATAYPNLTVRENLDIQRRLTRAPRAAVAEVIELMRLDGLADRRARVLSLGNKQRLSLARALLHRPELLILDEPANALDPAGIVEVRELLRSRASEQGVTVFVSSHILTEIAHLVDRIGIMHEGRLLEELDRDQLRAKERLYVEVGASEPERAAALLAELVVVIALGAANDLKHSNKIAVNFGDPASIGRVFLSNHLLAFEVISIVLLVAAIGGVILGAQRRRERSGGIR